LSEPKEQEKVADSGKRTVLLADARAIRSSRNIGEDAPRRKRGQGRRILFPDEAKGGYSPTVSGKIRPSAREVHRDPGSQPPCSEIRKRIENANLEI